jgi:hypothetical protein
LDTARFAFFNFTLQSERPGICFQNGMGTTHIATVITMIFASLIPSSCSKVSNLSKAAAKPGGTNSVSVAANTNTKDLGELSLTNHYETCIQLGEGKSCTIRPNVIDRKDLQLTMALESKKVNGSTEGLIVTQVAAQDGKSFEVAIGDMNFTLTPNIVSE